MREVERALFTDHAAALIGNQTLDFGKQDGVTEIEEALEARLRSSGAWSTNCWTMRSRAFYASKEPLCSSRACRTSRTSWIYQGRRCAT